MEKNINWHEITYQPSNQLNQIPCKRWGHKTVFVQDEIILFGGFSDVNYLNDLWAYNIHTNRWRQVLTTGKRPQGKSNFTMHYDSVTRQLLVLGGGGPNKRRYNKISMLNWVTKQWAEYEPKCGDSESPSQHQWLNNNNSNEIINTNNNDNDNIIPWQRTYHSSEFKYPYLIMFGGQGTGNVDLDDLWVFDVRSCKWTQIKTQNKGGNNHNNNGGSSSSINSKDMMIEGRKFHSTAMIDNQLFVIAGCRSTYTCIPNIYSIDLTGLYNKQTLTKSYNLGINNNNNNILENKQLKQQTKQQLAKVYSWKKHTLKDKQINLIEKWGHSSETYNGKIYLFGGRNQQDYNDLIEYNPSTQTLTKLSPSNKLPKSRRRHSSCMIGCSMVIFGGFNLQYFNDLQYISLFQLKDTLNKQNYCLQSFCNSNSISNSYELIELQEQIFHHFIQQTCKDKPQYDIQLYIESIKHKQPVIIKSVQSMLKKHSPYFQFSLQQNDHTTNPEHRTLNIPVKTLNIGMLAFQIFNTFMIKGLLILPKLCKLKKLYQLLICADYFMVKPLFIMIENMLTLRLIDQLQSVDDIFNIAANFRMQKLMKCCAQKKILNKTYYSSHHKVITINSTAAAKLKNQHIEQVLQEIRFDQIQKGPKINVNINNYHAPLIINAKQQPIITNNKTQPKSQKPRKRSFITKFVQSFTKLYIRASSTEQIRVVNKNNNSEQQKQQQQRNYDYYLNDEDDDDQDQEIVNSCYQIKMF